MTPPGREEVPPLRHVPWTPSAHPPSEAEKEERRLLGLPPDRPAEPGCIRPPGGPVVRRVPIKAPDVLNEAWSYEPVGAAFERGVRVECACGTVHIFLSGTASVGEDGRTLYPGDFRAQCWRTYRNLTRLLESQGATWHDVVRTTCYLRDIERDYEEFNRIRTEFYTALGLDPFPASTGIQARLCRSDLLIEIEAHAIVERPR